MRKARADARLAALDSEAQAELLAYSAGHTLDETRRELQQRHGIAVSRSALGSWLARLRLTGAVDAAAERGRLFELKLLQLPQFREKSEAAREAAQILVTEELLAAGDTGQLLEWHRLQGHQRLEAAKLALRQREVALKGEQIALEKQRLVADLRRMREELRGVRADMQAPGNSEKIAALIATLDRLAEEPAA